MNAQRVLLITPGFTADEQDQNCLPTLQLFVLELLQQQVEVQVIALDYPFSNKPYSWHGATVFPCGGHNSRWLKPRTIWRALKICQHLLTEGKGHKPVLALHSFWLGWASGIGEYVARRHGLQHITTLMGQDVLPQNRHRFRFLTQERQNRLVALSAFQQEAFYKHSGFQAGHIIPWGVSKAEIPPTLAESRPIDVLGAGSFIALKNWDLWLEIVAIATRTYPGLRAVLMGGGPEKNHLENRARQLGLVEIVQFAGDLPRPQVLATMQQAKLLLHTANYESQGYVLSEAAMNGCRIVGTPVGIAPDMGACANTAAALGVLVNAALQAPLLTAPVTPYLLSETVKAYINLYQSFSGHKVLS